MSLISNFYEFKHLSKFENIRHGISTREAGSMKNEDNSPNRTNLDTFLRSLDLPNNAVCMEQVHEGNVGIVGDSEIPLIQNTDGLITNERRFAICVLTADCLPLLFYDSKKHVIGVAHGGRKGLTKGIIKNMLRKFKTDFKSNPKDILVGIGPGIEKKCYEVEGEFLDIRKIANDQLLNEGILAENIENVNHCTRCRIDEFYSYRGGDGYKRFASVISLT